MIKAEDLAMGRLIWIIWVGPTYFRALKSKRGRQKSRAERRNAQKGRRESKLKDGARGGEPRNVGGL